MSTVPGQRSTRRSCSRRPAEGLCSGRFLANDARVLGWDVWNEPSNTNDGSYPKLEPSNKQQLVEVLLPRAFAWAREAHPSQPLTSGVWDIDFENGSALTKTQQIQLENSDVISFHNYGWPESFEKEVIFLEKFHRPLICTEFMARGAGSTFDTVLPLAKKYKVAAINWGFVAGKTQTYYVGFLAASLHSRSVHRVVP